MLGQDGGFEGRFEGWPEDDCGEEGSCYGKWASLDWKGKIRVVYVGAGEGSSGMAAEGFGRRTINIATNYTR